MNWQREARRAWDEHKAVEQDAAERAAAHVVDYVERLRDRLHVRPTAGTARLGEPDVVVNGTTVSVLLTRVDYEPHVELRAEVTDGRVPEVRAFVRPLQSQTWHDRGPVETLADLGRALDPSVVEVGPAPEEQSAGDLLLSVLTAIVRDVVASELDGRLSGGPP